MKHHKLYYCRKNASLESSLSDVPSSGLDDSLRSTDSFGKLGDAAAAAVAGGKTGAPSDSLTPPAAAPKGKEKVAQTVKKRSGAWYNVSIILSCNLGAWCSKVNCGYCSLLVNRYCSKFLHDVICRMILRCLI